MYVEPMSEESFKRHLQSVIDRLLHSPSREEYLEALAELNAKFPVSDEVTKLYPPQGSQISPPNEKTA